MTQVTTSLGVAAVALAGAGLLVSAQSTAWFGDRATPPVETAVVEAATGFARAYAEYDAADATDHLASLSQWTTPTYQQVLSTDLTRLFARLAAVGQVGGDVRIRAAGIKRATAADAEVLVALDSTVVAGTRQVPRRDRWRVTLVRDGSDWSVDGFTAIPVGGTP